MAYAYIKGIGVEVNIEKGKQYLDELDKDLKLKFDDDISNIDDPDEIIKDYYFSNMMDNINDLCILGKLSNNEYKIKKVIKAKKLELKEFKVPNYITNINAYAFKACSNLQNLEFSKSVKIIDEDAFFECYNLDKIYYDGTIEDWCNITFSNEYSNPMYYANHFYMKDSNNEYQEVETIVIPNTVTKIGNYQFNGFNITSITIPNSVKSIGESAFYNCTSLTSVTIPNSVTSIESGAFFNCSSLTSIEIPNNVTSIGESTFNNCINLLNIEIPNSITSIESFAFFKCINLTSIEIPSSITCIKKYAFSYCTSLTNIKIPSSIRSINMNAFSYCTSLKNIEIPSSVESIGYYAFQGCSNLKSINVNKNNKEYVSIEGNLYSYDQKILMQYALGKSNTSIEIPNSVTNIESFAFYRCSSLKSVTFEKGSQLTRIGEHSFYGCSSLTNIEIPSSITSIGEYAFFDCCRLLTIINNSDLELTIESDDNGYIAYDAYKLINKDGSITYKDEDIYTYIETTDDFLFRYDTNNNYQLVAYLGTKDTVTLPEDINGNSYEIYFMRGVKNVIIPNNFTSICRDSFNCCSTLASIEIPNSVTSIGVNAFNFCQNLTSIKIPNSVTNIGEYAFSYCTNLTNIEIPNSVEKIGNDIFQSCHNLTIYCEIENKPESWDDDWNSENYKVVWNYIKNKN